MNPTFHVHRDLPFRPFRGFSLIELLVVMAIVSLLVAMLLPALRTARQVAIRMQCLSNERMVGQMTHLYAADHRGYGAPHTYTNNAIGTGFRWFSGNPFGYTDFNGVTFPPMKGLDSYFGYTDTTLNESKIYWKDSGCPNYDVRASATDHSAFIGNNWIFGIAKTHNLFVRDVWVRLDDVRIRTNAIAMFGEGYGSNTSNLHFGVLGSRPGSPYWWNIRHDRGVNWIFVDGHGEFRQYDATFTSADVTPLVRVPGTP